jgi:hypothetical protein
MPFRFLSGSGGGSGFDAVSVQAIGDFGKGKLVEAVLDWALKDKAAAYEKAAKEFADTKVGELAIILPLLLMRFKAVRQTYADISHPAAYTPMLTKH